MCFGNNDLETKMEDGAMKKKKNTLRKMAVRMMLLIALAATASPFHLGNDYLRSADFDTVKVSRKDSVWTIASRYTAKAEDARELAEAIIEVNGLAADGALRVGQSLRIPILRERLPKLAEK